MKEESISQPFVYRSYTKAELAYMYVPNRAHSTAMKTFNKWIRHNPKLWKRLQRTGVDVYTQIYSTHQVRIIVGFLGEP